jgi:hypothetical protein
MTIISAVLVAALVQTVATPGQLPAATPAQVPVQPTPMPAPAQGQQPKPMPFKAPGEAMNNLQGFNIVLLIGESQSSGPSIEDVPAAARKALADMKEFLPFKHYRVLDSQWTSCCSNPGGSWISGRLQGVTVAQAGNETRLVPRSYSFQLNARADSRLNVQFTLTPGQMSDRASQAPITSARATELEKRLAELRRELETLEDRIAGATEKLNANHPDVLALRGAHRRTQQQIAETVNELTNARNHGAEVDRSAGSLINGSFMMDVGETVVVGTSRLGGDKALIAIVTAVRKGAR